MDIFNTIAGQMGAVRLPLFAVTLTALPRPDTPVLLMLHWHGFRRNEADAARPNGRLSAVPGSALQLNEHWRQLDTLDEAMLDAAWRLGAWELDREEKRGCNTVGASGREALECRQAFGDNLLTGNDQHLVADAPDRPEILALGAEVGYVRWQFRPVQGGVWKITAKDDTLNPDGAREPPCPVAAEAPVGTRVSRTRYRLGRSRRIVII